MLVPVKVDWAPSLDSARDDAGVGGSEENKQDAATRYVSHGMMGIALSPTVTTAMSTQNVQGAQGDLLHDIPTAEVDLPVPKGVRKG